MQALMIGGGGRGPGEPHFRLAGIPIRIELSFLIMGLIFGSSARGEGLGGWVAVLFVSVLFHELGPALAYKALGGRAQVLLYGMGGLTFGARGAPFSTAERVVTSLAGPFFGI